MNNWLKRAIWFRSERFLIKAIDFRLSKSIEESQYPLVEKALRATWHTQHEDLVQSIYLDNLIDDRFVDPIVDIAFKPDVYRKYDLETESTLRKCVHALFTINSEKSRQALEKLKKMNNENVDVILDMYK